MHYLSYYIDSASGSRLHILIHWTNTTRLGNYPRTLGNESASSITSPESSANEHPRLSAANQNQVLRNPSRQSIRIEHYVIRVKYYFTRELWARVEDPSRLSARVGSLEPILEH